MAYVCDKLSRKKILKEHAENFDSGWRIYIMEMVLITAIGVGGATLFGSLIGFVFKNISHRWGDIITSFAAGVMLAAAVLGLVLPSVEYGGDLGLVYAVTGIFAGAFCLTLIDKLVPHIHGIAAEDESKAAEVNRIMLFVTAIAIHNLPEGIAAGVSFGTGNVTDALVVAGGIALQNVPEGMVIIGPMLAAGISPQKTFLCALATGLVLCRMINRPLLYLFSQVSSASFIRKILMLRSLVKVKSEN